MKKIKTKEKPKTRKSISKRFKITKNGKVMRRRTGQMHYLAKNNGDKRRTLRRLVEMSPEEAKKIKKELTY
jgi:large subunit ribosomal protein L35